MSRAAGARSYFSVALIWRYVKLLCDHICSYICIPHPFSDILYEPTAPCYVPRAEGAGRSYFSVATIWRYVKQLCDHICCYICIPDMSDITRYGR
jgi:hypothetical protein